MSHCHTWSVTGVRPPNSQGFPSSGKGQHRIRRDGPLTRPRLGDVTLSHHECDGDHGRQIPRIPNLGQGAAVESSRTNPRNGHALVASHSLTRSVTGLSPPTSLRFPNSGKRNGPIRRDGPATGPFMSAVTLSHEECDGISTARFPAVPELRRGIRSNPGGRAREQTMHE
jgi:hypothetical protein